MKNDAEILWEAKKITRELVATHPQYAQALQGLTFKVWSMSACAGKAWPYRKLIKLSRAYYASEENFAKDFRDTVLHEIAHVLTPGDHHGPRWKMVARAIGCTAERCHKLQLAEGYTRRRRMSWVFQCVECYTLSLSRDAYTHGCPNCRGKMVLCKKALA